MLSIHNHDRDVLALKYVYPVVSRRAGGVSVGINLNPNNACNWQCVYCQVPNLTRGVPSAADLDVLRQEFSGFLHEILEGDFMQAHVPESCRVLADIAISGNGEPTTCPNFDAVIALIISLMEHFGVQVPLRLITNGSSVHKPYVQAGLRAMAQHHGEVWLKVDAIGPAQTLAINGVKLSAEWQFQQLALCARLCPTWLQTCVLTMQSDNLDYATQYFDWLSLAVQQGIDVRGVLLYGLARPSLQAGGDQLRSADAAWMQSFAQKIESLGIRAKIS